VQIADLTASIKFDADTKGLEQVTEGTKQAGAGTVAMGSLIATGVTKLAELGAAAVKAAAAFAIDLVTGFAEAGDAIAKTSKQLGVNAQELQRLDFAFKIGGASSASFTKATRALTLGLADAELKGTGPVVEGLELLGLEAEALTGLGLEDKMALLSDAFGDLGEGADASAAGMKLFGARAGAELVPGLLQGRDVMAALGDEAEGLGGVLGGESLESAEELTDSFLRMETFIAGVKNQIGGQLAPKVTEIIDRIVAWTQENDELLTQDLPEMLDAVIEGLSVLIPWIIDVAVETKNFFNEIAQLDSRLEADLGPVWGGFKLAIEGALNPLRVLIDLVLGTVAAVGKAVDKLASMSGALGKVGQAIQKLPGLGDDGGDVPATNVRGFAGGLVDPKTGKPGKVRRTVKTSASMSSEALAKISNDPTVSDTSRAKAKALIGVASSREVQSAAMLAQAKATIDTVNNAGKVAAAKERAQRRADSAAARGKKKGGKGGKGKKKASTGIPELDAILKDEAGGSSSGGGFAGAGGGGSSQPGTTINRIDQSFNAPTTITVEIPGANLDTSNPVAVAEQIAGALALELAKRDRRAADHFRSGIKV